MPQYSYTDLEEKLARAQRERDEALEREKATAEVLRVISSSPGDLAPVFEAILQNATRMCGARIGTLFRYQNGAYTALAKIGVTREFAEYLERGPIYPGPNTGLGRIIETKQTVHIVDTRAEQVYAEGDAWRRATADLGGIRSLLNVPLLKDGELVGAIGILREEVRPFTDKQIELVTNFAAQAVIAIENTRLLNELRQRTDDLSELLEQQTATSEVLGVISSSPGELEPVFKTMLANAVRICEASYGVLFRFENGAARAAVMLGVPTAFAEFWQREPRRPGPRTALGRVVETRQSVHIVDVTNEPAYVEGEPVYVAAANLGGFRTFLNVPMLKDNELIGVFAIYRQEVRPFTDKQIELVKSFAAQAVIAIENTRLLDELRESLQQQTATADVLKVISRSTFDLQLVLENLLESAVRLCGADRGLVYRQDGDVYRVAASCGHSPKWLEIIERYPIHKDRTSATGRAVLDRRVVHIHDILADSEYRWAEELRSKEEMHRTILAVPMLREGDIIGVIVIRRTRVQPFTDKQIELVTTFADQAVIAIENVRLFEAEQQRTRELTELLEQQTASSEVLQIISSSPGELDPVFQSILANGIRLCEANFGVLFRFADDGVRTAAMLGVPPAFAEFWQRGPHRVGPQSGLGRVIETHQTIHIADVRTEPAYLAGEPVFVAAVNLGGFRTVLNVPLLKDNELLGCFAIYRQEVRPFTSKQVDLLGNFAKQAVIAIENARLLNELRESLQQQTATADVLQVISRSAFELQPVFDALVESAVRLCEAERAFLFQFDGEVLRSAACYNVSAELREWVDRNPIRPGRQTVSARAALERRTVHVPDVQADPEYAYAVRDERPIRTTLAVPMLKGDDLVGTITLYRLEFKPFTDKQIALVETFADQAVIAIENVRPFDEVEARTRELSQSIGELRALGEVSQAVNSTLDLETVLTAQGASSACRGCADGAVGGVGSGVRQAAQGDDPDLAAGT